MSAIINFSDRSPGVQCDTIQEAVAYLRRSCDVVVPCGDRWLAWYTRADAEGPTGDGDDGSRACAEILVD